MELLELKVRKYSNHWMWLMGAKNAYPMMSLVL